jgi:hypothetical protein
MVFMTALIKATKSSTIGAFKIFFNRVGTLLVIALVTIKKERIRQSHSKFTTQIVVMSRFSVKK